MIVLTEKEIMLIARQLSVSEGGSRPGEESPASWVTSAVEIAAALYTGDTVERNIAIALVPAKS